MAEESARSQTQKANSESESKVLTADSSPPPAAATAAAANASTTQSNSGISSALQTQNLGRSNQTESGKCAMFFFVWCDVVKSRQLQNQNYDVFVSDLGA